MTHSKFPLLILLLIIPGPHALAQEETAKAETATPATAAEEDGALVKEYEKIESAIQAYVSAFNDKDGKKLASLWSPGGVYVSRSTGERIEGRDEMAKEFSAILAADDAPKLAVATESISFISPSVALERGTAVITRGEATEETAYNAVYVKQDDAWLLDRVTEDEVMPPPASNYEKLRDLEWLVGEWIDGDQDVVIEMNCKWTANQNYLSRTYSVTTNGEVDSSGLQIIGWDAKNNQIRSWLFDSNGGFVSGEWSKRDDGWSVQSIVTLPDGASGSFTSIFRPTDDGNYRWQKLNRVLDGQLLPNLDEVIVRRK